MKKAYYAIVFDENADVYASKICKTKLGRWLFIKTTNFKLKKDTGKCLKLGI